MGVNYISSTLDSISYGPASGNFTFSGVNTGLGLADFLLGRFSSLSQGNVYYPRRDDELRRRVSAGCVEGVIAPDAERWACAGNPTCRITGPQKHFNHFAMEQFRAGVRSTVYRNAPVGVIFEGDAGYPGNAVGEKQWGTFAPRLAGAWDIRR